jgi:hypothetical protein
LKTRWVLALLSTALPAFGQYAGPAILARGEAPAAMTAQDIRFRPFVEVAAIYDTGLAGVSIDQSGTLASSVSPGVNLTWGISGSKDWQHTKVGLLYRGGINHYIHQTFYDSTEQSLMLGVMHRFTRHVSINLREGAGIFSQSPGLLGLQQTVPFDPSTTYIPTTDYFDNRTYYLSTQLDLVIQKTARLSFDLGGDNFIVRRRSAALYGTTGTGARGDVQYRLTRMTTIGAAYMYDRYRFTRIFGGSDVHMFVATFGRALSRRAEISGYAGAGRMESKFIQTVPVDPAIAALLGIGAATQVAHSIQYVPTVTGRFSLTFSKGVAYVSGGHSITPGNGLFLTSTATKVLTGYTYTGVRRWSFNMEAGYMRSNAISIDSIYNGATGSVSLTRTLGRSMHAIMSYTAQRYSSPDLPNYKRVVQIVRIGFGFAPGDIPLRIW